MSSVFSFFLVCTFCNDDTKAAMIGLYNKSTNATTNINNRDTDPLVVKAFIFDKMKTHVYNEKLLLLLLLPFDSNK